MDWPDADACDQFFDILQWGHMVSQVYPALSYTMDPTREMYRMLKDAFERMMDVESAVQQLQVPEVFRMKHGDYGSEMAHRMRRTQRHHHVSVLPKDTLFYLLLEYIAYAIS
jgi:hypothetical protein